MQNRKLQFPASLQVTEQQIDLSTLTPRQRDFYLILFSDIVDIYKASDKCRVVVGIAGPTGAGKSVVAVLLKDLAKQAGLPFALESITIDAYHYPNSFLCSRFVDGEPLKQVKGRFDTYDTKGLARDIKAFAGENEFHFPPIHPLKGRIVLILPGPVPCKLFHVADRIARPREIDPVCARRQFGSERVERRPPRDRGP